MATLSPVGYVTQAGQDVLPSTGEHLDVRVKDKTKNYINPETIRSLLTRIKVGKENTPLWQQTGNDWKASFPITSGYGARSAPTAGASTFHPAHDYGVPGGTQIAWEGPGTFTPGKGYGTIKTADAQGNPYEISLLHTTPGKAFTAGQTPDKPPTLPTQAEVAAGNTFNFFLGGAPSKKRSMFEAPSTSDFLEEYMASMMQPQGNGLLGSLTAAFNSSPTLMV